MSKRNENRPGYKKTKVGWIPQEWECVKLKEVSDINPEALSDKTDHNYMFHYIDLSTVNEGKLKLPSNKITFREAPSRARRKVKKNDVLLSTVRPNLKGFAYISFEANDIVCSTGYAVLRSKKEVISLYLFYNLFSHETERYFYSCVVGSNYPALNNSDVNNLKIPLPPLPEQKKIAEILSAWDRAIEQVSKLIDAKQRLKKGLMQQLLTGRMRFPEFGKPVRGKGELPEGWREVRLGEVGKCVRGVSYKSISDLFEFETERTIRLLRANNINDSTINFDEVQYVIRNVVKREQILQAGDIVICMSSGSKNLVGKAAVYKETKNKYTVGAFCSIFRTKNQENKGFVQQLFFSNQYKRNLIILLSGTNINNLYSRDILKMKFFLPQKGSEQTRIAAVLSTCDREIELLKKKQEKLKEQKKGLIQKLLTGEVRVKI